MHTHTNTKQTTNIRRTNKQKQKLQTNKTDKTDRQKRQTNKQKNTCTSHVYLMGVSGQRERAFSSSPRHCRERWLRLLSLRLVIAKSATRTTKFTTVSTCCCLAAVTHEEAEGDMYGTGLWNRWKASSTEPTKQNLADYFRPTSMERVALRGWYRGEMRRENRERRSRLNTQRGFEPSAVD